jgi:hypothetical protein
MAAEAEVPQAPDLSETGIAGRLPADPAGHRRFWSVVAVSVAAVGAMAVAWAKIGWRGPAELKTFFVYQGDGLDVEALAHTIAVNGLADYPFSGSSFGWPLGTQTQHFPSTDWIHLAVLKTVTVLTGGDPQLALSVFFLLGVGLSAVAFFAFARSARVTVWVSAALAFAFAISPYVFYRSVHLFLAQVWVIPLALIPIVVALRGPPEGKEPWGRPRMGAVLIVPSAVVGAAGVYYAFFTLLAWVPAAVLLLPRRRQGLAWVVAPVTVVVTDALGLLPSSRFVAANPPYTEVAERDPGETLLYSGQAGDLVHDALGVVRWALGYPLQAYDLTVNTEALGLGMAGLIALLVTCAAAAVVLVRRVRAARNGDTTALAWPTQGPALVAVWVVVSVIWFLAWFQRAGINFVFATLISPQLRSYGRLTPFLIAVSLLGVGLIAARDRERGRMGPFSAALVGVLVLAAAANAATVVGPVYDAERNALRRSIEAYVDQAKAVMPAGCPVAQAPLVPWPEYPEVERMGYDESWRVALAAWPTPVSFGAVKGTEAAAWQEAYYLSSTATMAQLAAAMGFCWLSVDLDGYADPAAQKSLAAGLLGTPISEDRGLGLVAYSLLPLQEQQAAEWGAQAAAAREYLTRPVVMTADDGLAFGRLVGDSVTTKLVSAEPRVLRVHNVGDAPRSVRVTLDPSSAAAGVALRGATGKGETAELELAPGGSASIVVTGPSGAPVAATMAVSGGWRVDDTGLVRMP